MSVGSGANLAHYQLLDKLGEGGQGSVWRALDRTLDREVAIKLLPDEFAGDATRLARFRREARILAGIDHPAIVTIYSVEETDDRLFLTTELVRGKTLDKAIPAGGLPPRDFLDLAVPLADGIHAAHERGITHGDIKSGNVMVSDGGRVKILDFGLSRVNRRDSAPVDSNASTESLPEGRLAGTIPYMSPEQITGRTIDERSDIFSLGVVFHQMATATLPFQGDSPAELMAAILRDAPRLITELGAGHPRQLSRIVSRCLEKDPARRYASALDLRRELEAVRRSLGEPELEEVPSIAVLPFSDVSPEHDQDWFCEGLADEIINAIARIEQLRVASRISAFGFKNSPLDSREIGDRLGVAYLLEGSVRKAGQRLRITARLVDAGSGYQRWSAQFDRRLEDVFAIQDEIAQAVVVVLKLRLSPRERRAIKTVATASVEAYEFYLRGRQYYYQYGRRAAEFALRMFRRAAEVDPTYALAFAGIADCHSFLYLNAGHGEGNRRLAEEASETALRLDPGSAEALAARGVALSLSGRSTEADASFREAIRQDPKLFEAHYYYARECFSAGRAEQAIELFGRAQELRPEDYQSPLLVAQIHEDLGQEEQAVACRLRGIAVAEEHLATHPDDVRALYMAANAMATLDQRERALRWLARALAIEPDEPMLLYNAACICALAGESEQALEHLDRAIETGMANTRWIDHDSNLDSIRQHPRFASIAGRLPR